MPPFSPSRAPHEIDAAQRPPSAGEKKTHSVLRPATGGEDSRVVVSADGVGETTDRVLLQGTGSVAGPDGQTAGSDEIRATVDSSLQTSSLSAAEDTLTISALASG